jgi:hypothetical protein
VSLRVETGNVPGPAGKRANVNIFSGRRQIVKVLFHLSKVLVPVAVARYSKSDVLSP